MVQEQKPPVLIAQRFERAAKRCIRIIRGSRLRRCVEWLQKHSAASQPAQGLSALVFKNPKHPAVKCRVVAKAGQMLPCQEDGALHRVLALVRGSLRRAAASRRGLSAAIRRSNSP